MRNFLNFLIQGGLFAILKFSFETTFWATWQKKDDGEPGFCALADWIENWCNEKFPFSLLTAKEL